jgi:hypothetical protein
MLTWVRRFGNAGAVANAAALGAERSREIAAVERLALRLQPFERDEAAAAVATAA